MNTVLEKLKQYFENKTQEEVLQDWNSLNHFDNIGPTVEDIIKVWSQEYNFTIPEENTHFNYNHNPKKPSDFFIH